MDNTILFPQFANTIRNLNLAGIKDASLLPDSLQLARDGALSVYYCPFEYVNPQAKVVLVGITPGFTQLKNALQEAQSQLKAGAAQEVVLREAKRVGAFSGKMRPNLVSLLDHFQVNRWLGIESCDALFGRAGHLVHTTSVLRFPVFVDGDNYNGTPSMTKHPLLRRLLLDRFAKEASQLKEAVFVPLGPRVSEAMEWLQTEGAIDGTKVLHGMPHPSPANSERIHYMLGQKPRSALSAKTDPDRLDGARAALEGKMARLLA
jgi:hypothetical protein